MNNEVHGLCIKCIQKFNPEPPPAINYQCHHCQQPTAQFIVNDSILCLNCYLKLKQTNSLFKKSSELKNSSLLIPLSKSQFEASISTSFLSRNKKTIKKLQKILSSSQLKSKDFITQLSKKSILSSTPNQPISWQKIIDKCHKNSPLIFFFIGKQSIFGAFHTQQMKISSGQGSIVEDLQSGLFTTQRAKYELNLFKTVRNGVRYNSSSKSIIFGDPAGFEIFFTTKEITIRSLSIDNPKWQHFMIVKA